MYQDLFQRFARHRPIFGRGDRRPGEQGLESPRRLRRAPALDEAVANAIEHGNRRDPTKKIQATAEITQNRALISIQDDGGGFTQDAVNDPPLDENIERPHGRGLFLIKNFMTRVWHNEKGNVIYMDKSHQ